MTVTIDRLVRNQLLYHEVNERIREIAEHFDSKSEFTFICECSREDCVESIELNLDEYKSIRTSPTLFVVAPGHGTLKVENVVETNDRYALVETIRKLELVTESYEPVPERRA